MNSNKERAIKYIEGNQKLFCDVSRKIWDYAELSLKEYKSAELYCDILEKNGFKVEKNICGINTAFSGSFGEGSPKIAILGEFDALSGLSQKGGAVERCPEIQGANGHGCGHNMLGAGSLAAAFAIKEYLESNKKSGTVIFYGCPGEEGGAGKAFMARENKWREVDCALTWHPGDTNEIMTGTNNSCVQVLYKFKGVSAHAAGDPQNGRSALDAVELMNIGVQFLREHMIPDARIHYSIINSGGISPNVVQAEASVLYMVRAVNVIDTVELARRVDKIADGAALMTETEYEKVFIDGTANQLPNTTLEKVIFDNMSEIGSPSYTEDELAYANKLCETYKKPGVLPSTVAYRNEDMKKQIIALSNNGEKPINDFIVPFLSTNEFSPGSTDVGDVSWQTPTAQMTCVTYPSCAPGHSWQNVSSGASSIGEKGLLFAGKILACAAIDLFENGEIIEKAKEELKSREGSGYVCPIPDYAVPIAIEI